MKPALLLLAALGCGQDSPGKPEEARDDAARTPAEWPVFRGDRGLTGVARGALPERPVLLWSFEAGGPITSSPVVAGGRVYVGSDDHAVHCLDAATGASIWSFATEDIIEAPPLVIDGSVYVGSSDFWFYALDAQNGALRWKFETGDKILGSANWERTPAGLHVLVGSYDAMLHAFDAATGAHLWAYETDNYVNGTPVVADGRAYFGGCDAVLHMVSTTTGEGVGKVELGPDCHIAGSIAVADGRAYFGHYGNQFVCVDLAAQEVVWTYDSPRFPFFSSPAIGTDRVVFGGRDRSLHCARKSDGQPLWTFKTGRQVDGSPVIAHDRVVFGSGDGRLYVLDLASGEERWSYDIGKALVSSPAVVDGRIFVGSNDGKLYAFGAPADGERAER